MLRLYHRIAKYRSVPCMHSNSGAAVENLNRVFGQAQVHLYANQIKGDAVFDNAIRNQENRPNFTVPSAKGLSLGCSTLAGTIAVS